LAAQTLALTRGATIEKTYTVSTSAPAKCTAA
jgi:hypothetical protein